MSEAFSIPDDLKDHPHLVRLAKRINLAFDSVSADFRPIEDATMSFGIIMVNPLLEARRSPISATRLNRIVGEIFDGGDPDRPLTVMDALAAVQEADDKSEAVATLIRTVPLAGYEARRMCQYIVDAIDAGSLDFSLDDAMTLIRTIATPLPIERAEEIEQAFYTSG